MFGTIELVSESIEHRFICGLQGKRIKLFIF